MIRDHYLDVSKLTTDTEIMSFFDVINRHGGVLRFVGGAVRDALKGISGSDLNFATDLSPEELVEICTDEGIETIPIGMKQGSVGVVFGNKVVEVSSLYKYVFNGDGTADIEFTDNWEEDAARRDLTINAVYADEQGNVFDYYNGIEDLEKGLIRFSGSADRRIQEDYLRILRYFRFYAMFGEGAPDKKAMEACKKNCKGLRKIPMERIRDELFKLIQTRHVAKSYRLIQENGILSYIMPDAAFIDDLDYFNSVAGEVSFEDDAVIKMFILYRPDAALAENLATRLKFSRHQRHLFVALAERKLDITKANERTYAQKMVYETSKDFVRGKLLTECTAKRELSAAVWKTYDQITQLPIKEFELKGKDLLTERLCTPEEVGKILKELEQVWIDSDFTLSKEELLAQVRTKKVV